MIKVSILVPIYNVAQYIERCVISLMEQTYEHIEYVFVDDCSPDNSIEVLCDVIKKYPNRYKYIKIIHHNVNRGLALARNTALDSATGEYVFHVDSDDWIAPNCIALLVHKAKDTKFDIIDGAFVDVYKNRTKTNLPFEYNKNEYIRLMLSGIGIVSNQIWGRLIKRELYIKNNVHAFANINYGEDYSVLLKLLYYGKRAYINDVVYYYNHLNENSYMNNLTQNNYISLIKAKLIISNFYFSISNKNEFYFETVWGLINLYKTGEILKLDTVEIKSILNRIKKPNILNLLYKCISYKHFILAKILTFCITYKEKTCLR